MSRKPCKEMTRDEVVAELREIAELQNGQEPGIDSRQRSHALRLLFGPADDWQTHRLVEFALQLEDMRQMGEPQ